MHEKLHCANKRCEYNHIANELCNAKNAYYDHVTGCCMTFKKHECEVPTQELMHTFKSGCDKTQRGYRSSRVSSVLK